MSLDQTTLADITAHADSFRDRKQWLQAATLYGEVLENSPPSPYVWVQYAHMLKESQLFEEAVSAYRSAVLCDGTEPDARLHLAHLLKRLGRIAEALEAFQELSALPDAPHIEQEIAGLTVELMQAEQRTPAILARNKTNPGMDQCLAGFYRLRQLEDKRLAYIDDRNMQQGARGTIWDRPLVTVFTVLCRMTNERSLRARLDPKAHLVIQDGNFVATAGNPQFFVLVDGEPLQPGWFEVELELSGPSMSFDPVLYIEHSFEWARFSTFRLRPLGGGKFSAIGFIEDPVLRLRLDPASCQGSFTVRTFGFRQISLAKSLRQAYRQDRAATQQVLRRIRDHRSAKVFSQEIADILRYSGPDRYQTWIAAHDMPTSEQAALQQRTVSRWSKPPLISILIDQTDAPAQLTDATIRSLQEQSYDHWQLRVIGTSDMSGAEQNTLATSMQTDARIGLHRVANQSTIASVLGKFDGRFIVFVAPGDTLAPSALYRIAERSIAQPSARLIYGDEDSVDGGLRHSPLFKPDWDPDYFFASNYLGQFVAFETGLVAASCAPSLTIADVDVHDLILRASEIIKAEEITHIPRILYHRRAPRQSIDRHLLPYPMTSRRCRALAASLARQKQAVTLVAEEGGVCRVVWPLPETAPLVTLIVPTRDSVRLLRGCIESILDRTAYPAFEIIIVDNGSVEPETLAYFHTLRAVENIRVVEAAGSFNFAWLNNLAVEQAKGSVIALVNNDILAIEDNWLQEMVSQAVRPDVGAVGAKLLYPTGQVQHAGVVCGIGLVAAHPHKFCSGDDPGYMGRLAVTQSFSAVTAACLVVEKAKFQEVGGLDAENLQVAFNDVDFCLKLDAAGYRNIYTPHAQLVHMESVTRGLDTSPEKARRYKAEADFMTKKWGARIRKDPFYNVNLTTEREDFSIGD